MPIISLGPLESHFSGPCSLETGLLSISFGYLPIGLAAPRQSHLEPKRRLRPLHFLLLLLYFLQRSSLAWLLNWPDYLKLHFSMIYIPKFNHL